MKKIAIIGTGISGMYVAHFLQKHSNISHNIDLTIYEKNNYIGGHTNTVYIKEKQNKKNNETQTIPIDTGFMVFNKVNYPNLIKLFEELKIPIKKTSMSFSVQHIPTKLEYCGNGFSGLFAQKKNLLNFKFYKMLFQINRFNKESLEVLEKDTFSKMNILEYVSFKKFGSDILDKYLIPMSSAVWSTPPDKIKDFSIEAMVRFFYNHGLLGINTQHQWYTVEGGSQTYKNKLIDSFKNKIKISKPVLKVKRENNKVKVYTGGGVDGFNVKEKDLEKKDLEKNYIEKNYIEKYDVEEFDKVVFACHADEALNLIENPTDDEKMLLKAFKYQENLAILHTDSSVMPKNKKVWSSWNYKLQLNEKEKLTSSTTYWMNSLQQVSDYENYFININGENLINKNKILKKINYTHPIFNLETKDAQTKLNKLNNNKQIYFCGSYFKYGFHEDALTSAIETSKVILNDINKN